MAPTITQRVMQPHLLVLFCGLQPTNHGSIHQSLIVLNDCAMMEPRPSFRVTTRAKHTLPRLGFAQFRHRGSSPQLNHVRHRYIPATEDVCSVLDLGTGTYELPVSGLLVFSRCPR